MAAVLITLPGSVSGFRIEDSDVNATIQQVVSGVLYIDQILIDNTNNAGAMYLKFYDIATGGSVTVGTTEPNYVFPVSASDTAQYAMNPGAHFASGIAFACVTDPGTGGTTSPTNDVSVKILYHS